jgi:hypothetical protein
MKLQKFKSPNETKILPKTFETSKGRAGSHKLNESILLYCEIVCIS